MTKDDGRPMRRDGRSFAEEKPRAIHREQAHLVLAGRTLRQLVAKPVEVACAILLQVRSKAAVVIAGAIEQEASCEKRQVRRQNENIKAIVTTMTMMILCDQHV